MAALAVDMGWHLPCWTFHERALLPYLDLAIRVPPQTNVCEHSMDDIFEDGGLNPCAHSIWAFSGVQLYPELAAALVIHICERFEFLTFDVVDIGARTVVRCLANIRVSLVHAETEALTVFRNCAEM